MDGWAWSRVCLEMCEIRLQEVAFFASVSTDLRGFHFLHVKRFISPQRFFSSRQNQLKLQSLHTRSKSYRSSKNVNTGA